MSSKKPCPFQECLNALKEPMLLPELKLETLTRAQLVRVHNMCMTEQAMTRLLFEMRAHPPDSIADELAAVMEKRKTFYEEVAALASA